MKTSAMDARGWPGNRGEKWPSPSFFFTAHRPHKSKGRQDSHGLIPLAWFLPRSVSGTYGMGARAIVQVRGHLDDFKRLPKTEHEISYVEWVTPEEVFAWIMSEHKKERLDGVTFSGCDPFSCAASLNVLAALIGQAGLSIMAVSNYSWPELTRATDYTVTALLNQIDLLKCRRSAGGGMQGEQSKWEVRQLSSRLPVHCPVTPVFDVAA